MAFNIELPHVGESVTEAVIGKWLKSPGDQIEKYDPLVEVVTDKVNMDVPSPASGTLTKIIATEGETVAMGAVIAEMETADGEVADTSDYPAAIEPRQTLKSPLESRIGTLVQGANVGPTGGEFVDTSLTAGRTSNEERCSYCCWGWRGQINIRTSDSAGGNERGSGDRALTDSQNDRGPHGQIGIGDSARMVSRRGRCDGDGRVANCE